MIERFIHGLAFTTYIGGVIWFYFHSFMPMSECLKWLPVH